MEAAKPEWSVERRADAIAPVEYPGDIKNRRLAVARLDDAQEIGELLVEFGPGRPVGAVAGKFEVHGGRQGICVDGYVPHEVGGLSPSAPAEREEVVGAAADASCPRSMPVGRESPVDVVAALGRFDIGEVDSLARQLCPGDVALVM